jgi:hypothetical protein
MCVSLIINRRGMYLTTVHSLWACFRLSTHCLLQGDVVINRRRKRQSPEKQLQKEDNTAATAAAVVDEATAVIVEPRRSRRLSALAAAAESMAGAFDIHVQPPTKNSRKSKEKEGQKPSNDAKNTTKWKRKQQLTEQQRNAPSKKRKLCDPTSEESDISHTDSSLETTTQTSKTSSTSDEKSQASTTHTNPTQRRTCIDFLSDAHHNLVLKPFDATKLTLGISPYDQANCGKILQSPEYVTDIFQRLYDCEVGAAI